MAVGRVPGVRFSGDPLQGARLACAWTKLSGSLAAPN